MAPIMALKRLEKNQNYNFYRLEIRKDGITDWIKSGN